MEITPGVASILRDCLMANVDVDAFLQLMRDMKNHRNEIHEMSVEQLKEHVFVSNRAIELLKGDLRESFCSRDSDAFACKRELRNLRKAVKVYEKELKRRATGVV